MSDPKLQEGSRKSLRRLSRDYPSKEDLEKLIDDMKGDASDRTIAIVAVANVETALGKLISVHLHHQDDDTLDRLHERDGPLSSLFSKIELAYAMGLISNVDRTQLHVFRRVRNDFAHSPRTSRSRPRASRIT